MNPLSGVLAESWELYKAHARRLLAIAFAIYIVFGFLPRFLAEFLSSVIGGNLVAPFVALVLTLMYFRLSAATVGGPATAGGSPYGAPGPFGSPGPYESADPFGNQAAGFPPQGSPDQNFPPTSPPEPGFPPSV